MKFTIVFFTLGLLIFSFQSCKEKEDDFTPEPQDLGNYVTIDVQPVFDTEDLLLDSIYTTQEGYKIKFTDIKFFFEDIKNVNNQMIDAALFDYRARGTTLLHTKGKADDFVNLTANLGVGSTNNHSDPTAFPNESVLNISNSGDMHWNWSPGYIFVKIEAKADTIPDASTVLNHNIVFHAGLDVNLQTVSFTNLTWNKVGNQETLYMKLDMAKFLNGAETIDVKNEYSTHSMAGQEVLTLKVMTNFKGALEPY